ncbi:MAG TPA: HAD-IIB family hydrolase, partial [Erysipelothrix sp.]|nr:HAD-IIB family hydrolase [Erysipelothrix sp.]
MTFVFDLDGTLCFNDEPISYEIHQELKSLKEENLEVIFASARPIRDMLPVIHEDFHQHILIGGNGSLISRKGKVRIVKSFSKDELNKILALIEKYEATYLIDSKWDYAYTGSNNHPILKNLDVDKLANQVNLDELNEIVKILIL